MTTARRVILQARTTSSRLPGKVLLPLHGMAVAVLAARRAARDGGDVVVATSTDATDDTLAATLAAAGLQVHRGALEDVLGRFVSATADLPAGATVIRLTADNVVPDADLVERIAAKLEHGDAGFVGTPWPESGLPYGVSLEAFHVESLREAAAATQDPFDREHVTPWIRRHRTCAALDEFAGMALGRLRATIDNLDDYLRMARMLADVGDAVRVDWRELCRRLARDPDAPGHLVPKGKTGQSRLVLGTAQLGMPYGAANRTGMPEPGDAVRMVRRAIEHGVTQLDTARAYGASEQRVGQALADGWAARVNVVTKVAPLIAVPLDASASVVKSAVHESIFRSCHALGLPKLQTVLLHRAADGERAGVWEALQGLQAEGVTGLLGVSAQTPSEAVAALGNPLVRHMQLPFNVLDGRWEEAGVLQRLAARPDVTVHVRSALLQGILASSDAGVWPVVPGVDGPALVSTLARLAHDLGRRSVTDLCMAYVLGHQFVDGVVVGMETLAQLDDNLSLFMAPALDERALAMVKNALPPVPETLLDPARWPTRTS
jgi:spore coat polysaccharide biosynthesis protein SpsF (cytidylyltransferase family)/aryl-alcohol dehydrogenase-like predicted oxidoreductase